MVVALFAGMEVVSCTQAVASVAVGPHVPVHDSSQEYSPVEQEAVVQNLTFPRSLAS